MINKDKLIVRLATELYDLKQKLEDIRTFTDAAYEELKAREAVAGDVVLTSVIEVLNLIDCTEIYEE